MIRIEAALRGMGKMTWAQSHIDINGKVFLPADQLRFTFSRSGGPGGQNVNKVNTQVTLWFDLEGSPSLTGQQKEKIRQRLASRISKSGVLRVSATRFRTQKANREDALQRFISLVANALVEKPVRRKTKISRAARERRLQSKKRRSLLKGTRAKKKW